MLVENPVLFKIKYINRDVIDTTQGASGILGTAFHKSMDAYYGGNDEYPIINDADALRAGLEVGLRYLDDIPDGFINYSTTLHSNEILKEKFAFLFNSYLTEQAKKNEKEEIVDLEGEYNTSVTVTWEGKEITLPVPMKGYLDKIVRRNGKLWIVDYKTAYSFSNEDKIDGKKILQMAIYYFLATAILGEEIYGFEFQEVKYSKSKDGKQVQVYPFIYKDNNLMFDFFFRYYEDATKAIMGEQVFLPNFSAMFDSEVALISYIHRLDVSEEVAKQMKEEQVSTITGLLNKKIESSKNLALLQKTMERVTKDYKTMNYEAMTIEDRVRYKLMEYGIILNYVDKVVGGNVTQYRFNPGTGTKMKSILSAQKDIEQVLGKSGVYIEAPIQNSSMVGFNVPNETRTYYELGNAKNGYEFKIGVQIDGTTFTRDLRELPHMLISGATGAGKSVFIDTLIKQTLALPVSKRLLYIMDPKHVELFHFAHEQGVSYHSEKGDIANKLLELTKIMDSRYKELRAKKTRNIQSYNEAGGNMKTIYVYVDEFADLTSGETGSYIKQCIQMLAQKSRAVGIHLILATQRPSVKVIDGDIKANFPAKVGFRMAKEVDSQVLLDQGGAEQLLGKGDMLFSDETGIYRLQGFNI